jgi:hypothetical protein
MLMKSSSSSSRPSSSSSNFIANGRHPQQPIERCNLVLCCGCGNYSANSTALLLDCLLLLANQHLPMLLLLGLQMANAIQCPSTADGQFRNGRTLRNYES